MKSVNSDRNLEAENSHIVRSDPMTLEQGGSNTAVTRKLIHCWRQEKGDCCNKVCFYNKTKTVYQFTVSFCTAQKALKLLLIVSDKKVGRYCAEERRSAMTGAR